MKSNYIYLCETNDNHLIINGIPIGNIRQTICNPMFTIGIPKDSQKTKRNKFMKVCIRVLTIGLTDVIVPLNVGIPFSNKMETQYR